jgi:hypothetical protein
VRALDRGQFLVADMVQEVQHGFALDHRAHLERIADELQVDVSDLQSPLGHGDDQPARFQARNHLAHGAQRDVQRRHELALRQELPRPDAAAEDLLAKPLVGELAQRRRDGGFVRRSRLASGGVHGGFRKRRAIVALTSGPTASCILWKTRCMQTNMLELT